MKVVISDPLAKEGIELLEKESNLCVEQRVDLKPEELAPFLKDADALIVRSQTKVTEKLIRGAEKLKVIARAGVGIDNVDVSAATKRGILVMNTPGGNTLSTAEHTFSMMMALSRNIPQANSSVHRGEWDRKKYIGVELHGKTLGIVGLGRIGLEVAKRASAFQMKIVAFDPFLAPEQATKYDIESVDLDTLYARSDYITFHTPLTTETKGMINKGVLSRLKKGVRIINCARGGIIDESDLYQSLKNGQLAGAALDVFEVEPPKDSPLLELSNVIATPHLGAATKEAQISVAIEVVQQVIQALKGSVIVNAVNAPSLDSEVIKQIGPYMFLAEKMGGILAQISTGHLTKVVIKYEGNVSNLNVKPITLSAVKGMLGHALQQNVNLVNAPLLAKERGIQIEETKSVSTEDFADLVSIEGIANGRTLSLAGTLMGKRKDPRIVRINQYRVDAVLEGCLLVFINEDKPGMVAGISQILGKNKINIAGMTVGRDVPGGRAITVMNVDSPISESILEELSTVQHVLEVKTVVFQKS